MGQIKDEWTNQMARDNGDNPTRLRDTFAAAALTGLLSNIPTYQLGVLPRQAYDIADAMLEEREKTITATPPVAQPVQSSAESVPTLTREEREAIENAITLRLCDAKWEEDRNGMADNARARKAKREADTLLQLLARLA